MATREFKTVKELFLHPDAKENWNFMRFLSEFHCWFDKINRQHNGALFHDTIYDRSTEKNDQLIWDVETPSEKICDELGLYWWPSKIGHMCCHWANLSDEGVDIVIDKFEKFLDGNPDNDLLERLRISRLASVEKEIKEKKDALQKLETEREALNISPEQVDLNRKYLGKWIIADDIHAIYHVASVLAHDGYITITADRSLVYKTESQPSNTLNLTAYALTPVRIDYSANIAVVNDPMPYISQAITSIGDWIIDYLKADEK